MTEIKEIYIAKHNDDIIDTSKQFWEAKTTLVLQYITMNKLNVPKPSLVKCKKRSE